MPIDKFPINEGGSISVNQNIRDLKHGVLANDFSRFSVYNGDKGAHVGNDSPVLGRQGTPFGQPKPVEPPPPIFPGHPPI